MKCVLFYLICIDILFLLPFRANHPTALPLWDIDFRLVSMICVYVLGVVGGLWWAYQELQPAVTIASPWSYQDLLVVGLLTTDNRVNKSPTWISKGVRGNTCHNYLPLIIPGSAGCGFAGHQQQLTIRFTNLTCHSCLPLVITGSAGCGFARYWQHWQSN